MIEYHCPKCGKQRVAQDQEAGTTYTCSCGNVNMLPEAPPAPEPEPQAEAEPKPWPPGPPEDNGDDSPQVVYEGHPSQLENLPLMMGLFVVGLLVFLVLPGLFERLGGEGRPWWWGFWIAMGLTLAYLVWLTVKMLKLRCTHYIITEEHIVVESGVLFKNVDNIDMFRIQDVNMKQGLMQRFLGIGNLVVESSDQSMPTVVLKNIPDPRIVFERLRKAAATADKKRGVVQIEH
jgi:membrane protein YdbS with pleckstrin-like domain